MRSSQRSSGLVTLALVLGAAAHASAHRQDEYLQASRIAIEPDRVEIVLDLTPGIALASQLVAEIDTDGDNVITSAEGRAHAQRLLTAIALDVDGRPLPIEIVDIVPPTIDALSRGEGTTRVHAQAFVPDLGAGIHQLRYRNTYRTDIGAYLANALVPPSDRVTVLSQQRDVAQRDLAIKYALRADRPTQVRGGLSVAFAGAVVWILVARRRRAARDAAPAAS